PEKPIVIAFLPEALDMSSFVCKTGALTEQVHTRQQVRVVGKSNDQPVQVIRHEDERRYFNTVLGCSTQKLLACRFYNVAILEAAATVQRAHREEDAVRTDVQGRIELRRAALFHATRHSKPRASLG